MRWYTTKVWVDLETGEALDKNEIQNYTIVKKIKKYLTKQSYDRKEIIGITTIIHECSRSKSKQQELPFSRKKRN